MYLEEANILKSCHTHAFLLEENKRNMQHQTIWILQSCFYHINFHFVLGICTSAWLLGERKESQNSHLIACIGRAVWSSITQLSMELHIGPRNPPMVARLIDCFWKMTPFSEVEFFLPKHGCNFGSLFFLVYHCYSSLREIAPYVFIMDIFDTQRQLRYTICDNAIYYSLKHISLILVLYRKPSHLKFLISCWGNSTGWFLTQTSRATSMDFGPGYFLDLLL